MSPWTRVMLVMDKFMDICSHSKFYNNQSKHNIEKILKRVIYTYEECILLRL